MLGVESRAAGGGGECRRRTPREGASDRDRAGLALGRVQPDVQMVALRKEVGLGLGGGLQTWALQWSA